MAEHFFVRLENDDGACTSVVLDDQGHIVRPAIEGTLADAADAAAGRRVVVLVPGPDVILTQVALPAQSQARLRQMLPYSLEEAFAEDVERLHFAAGARLESGEVRVSAVARERMDGWLDLLADSGLSAQALYADGDGVADVPSTLNLVLDSDRVYGRRAGRPAFVMDGLGVNELYSLLESQSEDRSDLAYVNVYMAAGDEARYQDELDALQARVEGLNRRLLADGVLAHLAANLLARRGTNLLQGPYAPKSNVGALLKPWSVAAALLIALVAVQLIGRGAEYFVLRHEDAGLTETVEMQCRSQLSTSSLSACETAVRQMLSQAGLAASSRGGESFLTTLAALAERRDPASRIEALSYRNEVMDLQVVAPDIPSLDDFARAMTQTERFDVRIQSATPGDAGVEGRIQITGAAP
jgi:general secretion pathway protein L